MAQSMYTVEQERQINTHINKVLDILGATVPDDHFGSIDLSIPKQNGKIAGEISINIKQKYKRQKPE